MATVFAHTEINCIDWKKLCAFYEKVFGLTYASDETDDVKGAWFEKLAGLPDAHVTGCKMDLPGYDDPAPQIEFFTWEAPDDAPVRTIHAPGLGHLAFWVDTIEEKANEILAEGGSMIGEISGIYDAATDQTLVLCYAKDPEGNNLELMQWKPGKVC